MILRVICLQLPSTFSIGLARSSNSKSARKLPNLHTLVFQTSETVSITITYFDRGVNSMKSALRLAGDNKHRHTADGMLDQFQLDRCIRKICYQIKNINPTASFHNQISSFSVQTLIKSKYVINNIISTSQCLIEIS